MKKSNSISSDRKTKLSAVLVFLVSGVLCIAVAMGGFAYAESILHSPKQSIEQTAKLAVPPMAELQHKIVNVDLGSLGKVVVALYRASMTSTNFNGVVLIPETKPDSFYVSHLPPMREAEGLFDTEVISVFGVGQEINNKALVILYRYLRLGTGDDYKYSGYVYVWNGSEWTIDDQRSQLLVGVSKAALAKKKLMSYSLAH